MKSNNYFVQIGSLALLCGATACTTSQEEKRPNVIFILVDDLGKEWIPQYGAQDIEMPNLDRMAAQSVVFNNAYSMPQSTPSRVALMTGQYPYNNGWVNHYDVPRWGHGASFDVNNNPSLARLVRANGYKTCSAGKWQLNDFRIQPDAMVQVGFDNYCMWTGGEGGNEEISESRYWDPYIHTKEGSKQYTGEFGPDIYNKYVLDFIAENKKDPMFIYYAMTLTHTPFVHTPHAMDAKTNYEKHKAMTQYMDYLVGKVFDSLEENGIADNTYVILATDNGTSGACVGMRNGNYIRGGKTLLSENGINCPFMVYTPDQTKKIETNALVDFTDLFPTVLELTGTPKDDTYKMDGYSFASVLKEGGDKSLRNWALSMGSHPAIISEDDRVVNTYSFRDRAIMGENYKIYLSTEREIERVYALDSDPLEANNLVEDSEVMAQVEHELGAVISALPAQDANPRYDKLPHNEAFDFDLNEMVRTQSNKKGNYAPVSDEQSYKAFTKTQSKTKKNKSKK